MKKTLILAVVLSCVFAVHAGERSSAQTSAQASAGPQYRECVAVSLFTLPGRELNVIAENNRSIQKTNIIPPGWSVVGVTTATERGSDEPYMVICH